jgi:transposase
MKARQKYSKAFKLEALRRLQQGDKSVTELAFELGLRRNQLYLWQQQLQKAGPETFAPKAGRKKHSESDELTRLRKELADVTMERDILKKAAAYFAKDLK